MSIQYEYIYIRKYSVLLLMSIFLNVYTYN